MTPEQWQAAKIILTRAVALDTAAQRELIAREFASNTELRDELHELLAAFTLASLRLPWLRTGGAGLGTESLSDMLALAPEHHFAAGEMCGRYEVMRLLGAGGEGQVYLAQDTELSTLVALKVVASDLLESSEARIRLRGGAHNAARLRGHPHIATLLDVMHLDVEGRRYPVIVMEYVEGQSCADHLADHPMSLTRALRWAIQIVSAVEFAHDKGVLHCDLKPQNVQITTDDHAKVLDFGISRALYGPSTVAARRGTLAYMAPEQLRDGQFSEAGDVYSLGVTIFELITRSRPFAADTQEDLVLEILAVPAPRCSSRTPGVPEALDTLVERALAKAPRQRPQSASELRQALEAVQAQLEPKPARGRPWWRVAAIMCTVLVAATFAGFVTCRIYDMVLGRTGRFADESALWWPFWGFRMLFAPIVLSALVMIPLVTVAYTAMWVARAVGWSRNRWRPLAALRRVPLASLAKVVVAASAVGLYLFVWRFLPMIGAFQALVGDTDVARFAILRPDNFNEHNAYRYTAFLMLVVPTAAWTAILARRARSGERVGIVAPAAGLLVGFCVVALWAMPYRLMWHGLFDSVLMATDRCYVTGRGDSDLLLFCPTSPVARVRTVDARDPRLDWKDSRIEKTFTPLNTAAAATP